MFPVNSMPDYGLIDLMQTPKSSESGSGESDPEPERRGSFQAFLILVAFLIPIGILFFNLGGRPVGLQPCAMVAYTFAIPYIASDRFLNLVPWAILTCRKFLLEQNHDRYTRGQCLRVLIFQEINTLKNAFQGTFIVILL
jgi:hypothetical protein